MRPLSALYASIALLLGLVGQAAAAVQNVPRMERVAACSWDRPGHNPFMGDVVAAIDRYSDIPTLVRIKLKQRMQARQYDDLVDIRRDTITGRERYEPTIRDMHFGLDRVCRQVTRARWTTAMHERGLVYCEQGYCILVPTVCRNVSRVDRRPTLVAGESIGNLPPEAALAIATPRVAPTAASSHGLSEPSASRQPTATSSFAEAVAGAVVPLWPIGREAGPDGSPPLATVPPSSAGDDDPAGTASPPALGPPWWPPIGGGGGVGLPPGSPGGSDGGRDDGDGFPGGGTGGLGGGGGGSAPVTAVPEPSTWVSLLAGLVLLVSAQRRRRRRAAPR